MRALRRLLGRIPWRARFVIAYIFLGLCVAGAYFGVVYLLLHKPPKAVHVAAPRLEGPELAPAATQFATSFSDAMNAQDEAVTVEHVSCVQGSPDDFACAWWLTLPGEATRCQFAQVHRAPSTGEISVAAGKAGRVPVALPSCTPLHVFRWAGGRSK